MNRSSLLFKNVADGFGEESKFRNEADEMDGFKADEESVVLPT